MRDVMSPKETVSIIEELVSSQHGNKSRLAHQMNVSPQTMRYRIGSLCKKIVDLDKEVHETFFSLGQNVVTEYRIIEGREKEEVNEELAQYTRAASALFKPASILPLYAPSKKLRSDNQINSRIHPVCYWLKCCIGARFSKTRSTGRKHQKVIVRMRESLTC